MKASKTILSKYPKEEYAYIGIGRGPVPIMAYLQTEPGTITQNIPLTAATDLSDKLDESKPEVRRIYKVLDQFFPDSSKLNGRKKVLLIDFVVSGQGLQVADAYTKAYLKSKHSDLAVKSLGIAVDAKSGVSNLSHLDIFKQNHPNVDYISVVMADDPQDQMNPHKNDHMGLMMACKFYRDRAEYGEFDPQKSHTKAHLPRSEYQIYLEEMRQAKVSYGKGELNDEEISCLFSDLAQVQKHFQKIQELDKDPAVSNQVDSGKTGDREDASSSPSQGVSESSTAK